MSRIKERTCVVCGEKEMKHKLLRWVFIQKKIHPDWTQKLPGRSVYTHFNGSCLKGIYDKSRAYRQLVDNDATFAVDREKIFDYVENLSISSLSHFFSLGIKSRVMVKGQNLLED
ncbi:MAG TPA: YlxR family protein, partial [bacterium]|nr:YlxR family protein [bacterium]